MQKEMAAVEEERKAKALAIKKAQTLKRRGNDRAAKGQSNSAFAKEMMGGKGPSATASRAARSLSMNSKQPIKKSTGFGSLPVISKLPNSSQSN